MNESGKMPGARGTSMGGAATSQAADDVERAIGSEGGSASGVSAAEDVSDLCTRAADGQAGEYRFNDDVYRQTLDTVADAVFHLDSDKRVVWMNNAAATLSKSVARFRVSLGQRLQTGDSALDGRVSEICRGREPRNLPLVIDARNDAGTLFVGHVRGVDGGVSDELTVAAMLIVHAAARGGDWSDLVAHFGLTAAEVQLTQDLVTGMTLDEAAIRRGTSIHTVRNQLRSVLSKTGTNRQSELVGLLTPFAPRRTKGDAA